MVAKETVYGTSSNVCSSTVAQVSKKRNFVKKYATNSPTINDNARKCYRCGNSFFFAIFILRSRESELYRYTLDGKSALAWELPFSRFMGHLSST